MFVSDVMCSQVASVRVSDHASIAARLMWDCDCGVVPVVDEDGRAVGMLTDRDICMAALHQDRPPSSIAVWEAMSKGLYSCSPGDSLRDAGEVMRKNQIRRLPVLDQERRLVGILSLADVVRATTGRKVDDVTTTLADICAPRRPTSPTPGPVAATG
jgi:CBS domain-containing protein